MSSTSGWGLVVANNACYFVTPQPTTSAQRKPANSVKITSRPRG